MSWGSACAFIHRKRTPAPVTATREEKLSSQLREMEPLTVMDILDLVAISQRVNNSNIIQETLHEWLFLCH